MADKVQLIKEEIKRLKHTDIAYDRSRFMLLLQIEDFIDSLPEEHNENLEEEYDKYFKAHEIDIVLNPYTNCKDIARHFAEWQHGKDFDDLLQSEMKFPKEYYERGKADAMKEMKETLQTEYEKGRFDMREEMMKDALDGCVSLIVKSDMSSRNLFIPTPQLYKELQKYNDGDKLKIIIVKED